MRTIFLTAALTLSAASAEAQRRGAGEDVPAAVPATLAESERPTPRALPDAEGWKELLVRDRRVAFTPRTGADARTLLAQSSATPEKRAAAWLALGSSGAVNERLAMEDLARHGSGIERRAVILALGELASGAEALLTSLVGEEPEVAECALLALLRSGRAASRRRVEEIAQDDAHRLHAAAGNLLVYVSDPAGSAPNSASVLLLELRWEAGRKFGLVDGQSWHVLQVQRLANDADFRREFVLRGAARLHRPGAKDHLLQLLLDGKGDARLSTATILMPLELEELVVNDLWRPSDAREWRIVLDTIESRSLTTVVPALLERAAEVDRVHYRAAILIAKGGTAELARFIDPDFARLTVEDRLDVCDALATSGDAGWRTRLEDLEQSLEPTVRLAALVGRMRLGSAAAEEAVRAALNDPEHVDHAVVVEVMQRVARDPFVGNLLEDYLPRASEDEALGIAIALCRDGRVTARSRVRAALAVDPTPKGADALVLLTALSRRPGPEDLELFHQIFPLEDERAVEVELASALFELGDPVVLPILRASLWRDDFDLSLLAAALLAEASGGVRSLRAQLRVPPEHASSTDLRRVGFAIGAWGGLREVEELARELRYSSGHPALQGALFGALSTRTH